MAVEGHGRRPRPLLSLLVTPRTGGVSLAGPLKVLPKLKLRVSQPEGLVSGGLKGVAGVAGNAGTAAGTAVTSVAGAALSGGKAAGKTAKHHLKAVALGTMAGKLAANGSGKKDDGGVAAKDGAAAGKEENEDDEAGVPFDERWPAEFRAIKSRVVRLTLRLKLRAALALVDVALTVSGFPRLALASLRPYQLDVVCSVRAFWHVQGKRMKVAILPDCDPEVNLDVGLRVLCCCIPAAALRTLAPLVLKHFSGRFFDIDLSKAGETAEGAEAAAALEQALAADDEDEWHDDDDEAKDACGTPRPAGADLI